eukprot:2240053-Prymnesium_polylepis.1
MAAHKFVAAPSSHGQDTYRFWEALYVGSVPITLHGPLDRLYSEFPCILLDDWNINSSQIDTWSAVLRARWGASPTEVPRVQAMLMSDFWAAQIRMS